MSDVTPDTPKGGNFLNNKVSGIKTSYLIIFGLVVAVGAYYWRKRKGATTPVIPTVVDTSGQAGGFPTSGGGGGGSTVTPPVQQTNAQWARAALNAAIGNGSVDATDGANAVTAFLNGQPLTTAQASIMAKLTTAYGQPPEGVLPISTNIPSVPVNNTPTRYIRDSRGQISAETATGSTYILTLPEWEALAAQGATYVQLTNQDYNTITHPVV